MRDYVAAVQRLVELQHQLGDAVASLQHAQTQLEQEHAQLLARKSERQQLLAAADAELAEKGNTLEQLERDRTALQKIIDRIEQERALATAREAERLKLAAQQAEEEQARATPTPTSSESEPVPPPLDTDVPSAKTTAAADAPTPPSDTYTAQDLARLQSTAFPASKGKLLWPVAGKPITRFGEPRQGSITWDGLRIRAQAGSDVRAVHYGRVMYAEWLRGQGMLLVLDHGDGYMSLYAHNDVLLREQGEWVKAGDTIARVGNSGGEKDSALYFEIRKNGQPINPQPWLSPQR